MEEKIAMKAYCYYCDDDREVSIREESIKTSIKGIEFAYPGLIANCDRCKNEVYISELHNLNVNKANEVYREHAGIIKISKINELLEQYNIGLKPLALLLGWGETTIIRYTQGLMPSQEYSARLMELFNPYKMREVLEKNRNRITDLAQKKLEASISSIIEADTLKKAGKIGVGEVIKFFLNKMDPEAGETITHLKLQKLLYFTQAWSMAINKNIIFTDDFEAWQHGPVIPSLYTNYKPFSYNSLPKLEAFDENVFTEQQKEILNMVWKAYGKYDGKYLEKITHSEEPWILAWERRKEPDRGNITISKESILKYYTMLKARLNIGETDYIDAINNYISTLKLDY